MSKRAGPALEAFKDLVFPEGYTPGAGKRKVCITPKIINPTWLKNCWLRCKASTQARDGVQAGLCLCWSHTAICKYSSVDLAFNDMESQDDLMK